VNPGLCRAAPDDKTIPIASGLLGKFGYSQSPATGHIPGAVNLHNIFSLLATSSKAGLEEPRDKFAEAFGASGPSDMVAIKPGRTCTMSMSGSIAAHRLMALISAPAKDAFRAPSGWTGVG